MTLTPEIIDMATVLCWFLGVVATLLAGLGIASGILAGLLHSPSVRRMTRRDANAAARAVSQAWGGR